MRKDVTFSWQSIAGWLGKNAPHMAGRIRPPAPDDAVYRAARTLGTALPPDLHQWWRLADGMDGRAGLLPPGFTPLSVSAAMAARSMQLDNPVSLYGMPEENDREAGMEEPAATGSNVFIPHFLPVGSNHSGELLVVDLRTGPLTGCIGLWTSAEGYHGIPVWLDVAEMLAEVSNSLTLNHPAMLEFSGRTIRHFAGMTVAATAWFSGVDDGDLHWQPLEISRRGLTAPDRQPSQVG